MKQLSVLLIFSALLLTGCATIYVVRHSTVEGILEKKESAKLKRYRVEGYAVSEFEHRAIYGSLEDAKASIIEKGIWLEPVDLGWHDPFGRTKQISKVKLEGTVWLNDPLYFKSDTSQIKFGVGHGGAFQAELKNIIVLERKPITSEAKTEPASD